MATVWLHQNSLVKRQENYLTWHCETSRKWIARKVIWTGTYRTMINDFTFRI